MDEEQKQKESESGTVDNTDYIAAIKELKENSVSKDDYLKLKAENKKLLDSLVAGETIEKTKPEEKESIESIKNRAFATGGRNIDIVQGIVDLRNRLIENGEPDPFLPNGHEYNLEYQDELDAQNVADLFQTCLDAAQGDPDVFDNEFQRHLAPTPVINKKRGN